MPETPEQRSSKWVQWAITAGISIALFFLGGMLARDWEMGTSRPTRTEIREDVAKHFADDERRFRELGDRLHGEVLMLSSQIAELKGAAGTLSERTRINELLLGEVRTEFRQIRRELDEIKTLIRATHSGGGK